MTDTRPCANCGHLESEHGDDIDEQCYVGADFLDARPLCYCMGYEAPK